MTGQSRQQKGTGFEQGLEPKFSKSKSWAVCYTNTQFLTTYIQELDKWNTPVKRRNQIQQGEGPSTGLTRCFCQIQPSLHSQRQWDEWDPPRDQGGERWGGLHGLSGQEEEKQFPVRSTGEQRHPTQLSRGRGSPSSWFHQVRPSVFRNKLRAKTWIQISEVPDPCSYKNAVFPS